MGRQSRWKKAKATTRTESLFPCNVSRGFPERRVEKRKFHWNIVWKIIDYIDKGTTFFLKNNSVLEIYTPSTKVSKMQTINGLRPLSKTNLAPCFSQESNTQTPRVAGEQVYDEQMGQWSFYLS